MVVDLRVSQVALLTTAGDQLFDTRLLLRFSGHNTLSTEGLGGQKTSRGLYPSMDLTRQMRSGFVREHSGSTRREAGFFPRWSIRFDGIS
ncbi:MAG TPA: hypothetical protein DIC37_09910 [Pseudomonas sp.]|nr:hypothetical protein [Pseudomonas sp.]